MPHFTEMLKSRMFRDLMLGDNGTDGTDTALFNGTASSYTLSSGTSGSGVDYLKIAGAPADGTDLLVGIDNLQFGLNSLSVAENLLLPITQVAPAGFVATEYTLTGVDEEFFDVDSSGNLVFMTYRDFEAPEDDGANNVYNVTVTASNGAGLSIIQSFAVAVTNVNEAPAFTTGTAFTVNENTLAVDIVQAADIDLPVQIITYSISGGMDANMFTIDAQSGALSFVTAPDHENPLDDGANNIYDVTVRATDNGNPTQFVDQSLKVTVENVDEAPVFNPIVTPANYAENDTVAVATLVAVDPESVPITYDLAGADATKFEIVGNQLKFITSPNFEANGSAALNNSYQVTVTATDGTTAPVAQSLTINVTNIDEAGAGSVSIASYIDNGSSAALKASNDLADPDVPAGVVVSYQWSRNGIAAGTAPTLSSTGIVATYTLQASYVDGPFGTETVSAAETFIVGTGNSDTITGTGANETILGLNSNDRMAGGAGTDTLVGGSGTDVAVFNSNVADATFGVSGGNLQVTTAAEGTDTLISVERAHFNNQNNNTDYTIRADLTGTADNTFTANNAPELFIGLGGTDTVVYSSGNDVTANLATGLASNGDRFFGIENLTGGGGDDTLTGDSLANILSGGSGSDRLTGGVGNDTLNGGSSNTDVAVFSSNVATATFSVSGGNLQVTTTAEGTDTLISVERVHFSNLANNTDYRVQFDSTGTANNTFNATSAPELFIGLGGNDTVVYNGGPVTANLATGIASNGDRFFGIENLRGSGSNNSLTGDSFANILTGGSGVDTLTGGASNDTFVFADGSTGVGNGNRDVITDFATGDVVDLSGYAGTFVLATAFATGTSTQVMLDTTTVAGSTLIHLDLDNDTGTEAQILLLGYTGTVNFNL